MGKSSLNYMSSDDKDTGNQPWGEDLFQQRCMDLHGVDKVAGYDLNTDASCAAWRPEGEKKNRKWLPIAPSPRPQQCTTSRHQSCTSTASRPLNVKLVLVVLLRLLCCAGDNVCFTMKWSCTASKHV